MIKETEKFSAHVRAFSRLLIELRSELGNDLDMVLILSVIAERHYAAMERSALSKSRSSEALQWFGDCGINAHSVALYTGIPRETVRRKIKMLVERAWVECDTHGNLTPTARAAEDLAKGTAETQKYIRSVTEEGKA